MYIIKYELQIPLSRLSFKTLSGNIKPVKTLTFEARFKQRKIQLWSFSVVIAAMQRFGLLQL